MKRIIPLLFLLIATASHAQSLDLLTGLHPRPQVTYLRPNPITGIPDTFQINSSTKILLADTTAEKDTMALAYLQHALKLTIGDTLEVLSASQANYDSSNVILMGEIDHSSYLYEQAVNATIPEFGDLFHSLDTLSRAQGYLLDVDYSDNSLPHQILLAGWDRDGTFNAVSTFAQLLEASNRSIPDLFIYDWPDYPIRWVFSTHNLMVPSQVTELEGIEDSMAAHKLNGLQQNDFKNNIYDVLDNYYFSHVDTLQAYSVRNNIELIPGVFPIGWSEGILFHDPDLAEGIPTTTRYYIADDTGQLIQDPRVSLPNGNFENASGGKFPGWGWYDPTIVVDSTTVHSGRYSARATNFSDTTPNGRFIKLLTCSPHHGYHLSAWYKTQGFSGEFNLLAIGFHGNASQALTFTQFSVPATSNDWQQANVVFNTLNFDSLYVYCGVWSGQAGTIWFDDFNIEDAGMTNLLRRPDEMPTVTVAGKSGSYMEGRDYAMLVDSSMEKDQGSYPWHPSPGFNVLPGSAIHNGDTVTVNFIRPNPVINDPSGDGSTMVCLSEDTLYSILHDQLSRVDAQYHAPAYFMSHDEIREMNWDSACQSRKFTPAQLLANNVRKCDSIIHEIHPGAQVFDWSDMFDPLHNAHNNYYLVNGDLSGDWKLIPKDFTIVNWNGGHMSQSLNFFSKLGFSQITSPYYDVQNTNNIRAWRLAMDSIPNMRGMMYTTWADDYSFLTPFADYAWSAGPMIIHTPLTSSIQNTSDSILVEADVFPDPYLSTDSIVSVTATIFGNWGPKSYPLYNAGTNHYKGSWRWNWDSSYTYSITAVNSEGLRKTTPQYKGLWITPASVQTTAANRLRKLFPNPASNAIAITGITNGTVVIENMLGREVERFAAPSSNATFDIHNLPSGAYECIITDNSGERTALPFVKE